MAENEEHQIPDSLLKDEDHLDLSKFTKRVNGQTRQEPNTGHIIQRTTGYPDDKKELHLNTVEWTKKNGLLAYLWSHTQQYRVILGVDGYPDDNKIQEYIEKRYAPKLAEKITFIAFLLMGKFNYEIYYHSDDAPIGPIDDPMVPYAKLSEDISMEEVEELFKKAMVDGSGTIEILFTDEYYCQFLLEATDSLLVTFYNMTEQQQKYVAELLDHEGLSARLITDPPEPDL